MEQIEKNFKTQYIDTTNTESTTTNNVKVNGEDRTDTMKNNDNSEEHEEEIGVNVIDLTMMAIEGVFEGQVNVNRMEIDKLYKQNEIDAVKLSFMKETDFSSILVQCEHST